jgi:hypothetical protein
METRLFCIFILLRSFCLLTAQNNNDTLKPEKVFLHTDRNIYTAGDNLFYTLYLDGNPGQMSKYAYLVLRDYRNSHVKELRLEINNRLAFGSIYLSDTLNSGIYQIVCYTNCMRNDAEESYFTKEIVIANRFDENIDRISEIKGLIYSESSSGIDSSSYGKNENLTITLNNKIFNPREKISVTIQGRNLPGNTIAHLSVSISEITPGVSSDTDISEYFSDNNSSSEKTSTNMAACKYSSEYNGSVLQGRIFITPENISSGDSSVEISSKTSSNYTLLVSTPDSVVNMQFTKVDSSGSFRILLNRFYDGKELMIRLKESVKAILIPDNKFTLNNNFIPSHSFNVPGIKAALIRNGKLAQVRKIYNEKAPIKTEKEFFPAVTIPRLYYSNFISVYPTDYIRLNDFAEITKEIIPALRIRKVRDNYFAEFPGLQYTTNTESGPAIFLDGVPIDDINQVITMGSDQIKRIELLPEIRYYGNISFSGILAIFTPDLKIRDIQFRNTALKMYALLSQPYTRPVPFTPENIKKHYPDVRQLLLWEPEIILDNREKKQFEFYASDIEGKFRIDIQGITSSGITVHGSEILTIKSKPN